MVDVNGYINSAIDQVFGQNKVKLNIAKNIQSEYSGDTKTLLDKLGSLCNCDFSSLANLRNVAPTQEVNDAISVAITNAGGQAPSDILVKKRIQTLEDGMGTIAFNANNPQTVGGILGSTDITSISTGTDTITAIMGNIALTTTAKTLSGSIVELDAEMGSATLTTTAQTAKGAINELDAEMGSATLTTTAQTVKAAINELDAEIGHLSFHSNNGQTTLAGIIGSGDISSITTAAGAEVANTITATIAASDAKFGDMTSLSTSIKSTVVGALNELYATILTDPAVAVCGKVGTLGSFYSCTSLDDTSPTLIATGSELCAAKEQARQKCANWAFLNEWSNINSKLTSDSSSSSVFVSISGASGSCFNVVGDLQTLPTIATTNTNIVGGDAIPSLKVNCVGSSCSTVPLETEFGYDRYLIPSLPLTCIDNVCTTSPITITTNTYGYSINIPSLTAGFLEPTAGSLYALCMYELDH